jgi:uncharacterized membrane protein YdjX (TVP38/TMEM64 family)
LDEPAERGRTAARLALRLAVLLAGLAALLGLLASGAGDAFAAALRARAEALGPAAPLLVALAYLPGALLLLPAAPLTAAAGWLFGFGKGLLLAALAGPLGATATFLLAGTAGRPLAAWLARRVPHFALLAAAVRRGGAPIVVLLRLSPVVPFSLLNYALGLSGMPVRRYAAASLLGMLPGAALYAWLGSRAPEAASLLRQPGGWREPRLLLGGATLLLFTAAVLRTAGRRLARDLEEASREVGEGEVGGSARGGPKW